MTDKIKEMKKIELHLHLDGSLEIETAMELSGLDKDEVMNKMIASDKCRDLTEYLTKFDLPISIMKDKNSLVRVASDLVKYLDNENVIYAEVRFAPIFHTKNGLSMEEVIEAVLEGLSNGKVKTNLILCMMRGMDKETNLMVIDVASKYLGKGVCAVDLAGDECTYPLEEYLELFEIAKRENIPFTIHAGESGSAIEVKKAIEIGATRIGHGIHSIEDDDVLELIKEKNVLLEICPTSNVQTNNVEEYFNHPIDKLYRLGIRLNINTDNKTVSNVSISEEYQKLRDCFKFSDDDFRKMNIDALESAFISEEEKQELLKELD